MQLKYAIGLFHIHAHQPMCYAKFATSFIEGIGHVAGEILESLWSQLNPIASSCRVASLGYRAELIDRHTADSNKKKLLNCGQHGGQRSEYRVTNFSVVPTTIEAFKRAEVQESAAQIDLEAVMAALSEDEIAAYDILDLEAQQDRYDVDDRDKARQAMSIYEVKTDKREL